jgi:hypothetical protein
MGTRVARPGTHSKSWSFVARNLRCPRCITATIALRADASRHQRVLDHQAVLLTKHASGVKSTVGEGQDIHASLT